MVSGASSVDNTLIAGANIDRTFITSTYKGIKIIYRGEPIAGVTRSGKITIELIAGSNCTNAGSMMKITFENVKVTYMGKSVTYNGVRYITNIGGGLPYDGTRDTVRHKVRVNATATFSDNTVFTWWAAAKINILKA